MFTDKFKKRIAAAAVMIGILLTSCSRAEEPVQTKVPDIKPSESVAASASESESSSGTNPFDPDEDLSKYDLNDSDTLEEIVSKMENKYGIDIVYGNDIRTEFKDENETIRAKPNTNYKDIETALRSMDEGLNALPGGFMKQIAYGRHKILKIYLTGKITIDGYNGKGVPAFTSDTDDELYLTIEVLDQGVINVPTVLHEITHIVDFKLKHDGLLNEDEWAKLNPEGFTYDNSYGDSLAGKKDPKYCYSTECYIPHNTEYSNNDIWFYYPYSKVNAYEDRATMLEDLIIYKMWKYEVAEGLYKCPHMKAKVEFFLKLIEKDFKMSDKDKAEWQNAFKAIS